MSALKSLFLAGVFLPLSFTAFAESAQPAQSTNSGVHQVGNPVERHKAMCTDRYARQVGKLATLEAKLNLTDSQRSAWTQWRQAELDGAGKARDACLEYAPKPGARPTILERQERREKLLSIKLQAVQASQPALKGLYGTLTAEQKAVLDLPPGERRNHHGNW